MNSYYAFNSSLTQNLTNELRMTSWYESNFNALLIRIYKLFSYKLFQLLRGEFIKKTLSFAILESEVEHLHLWVVVAMTWNMQDLRSTLSKNVVKWFMISWYEFKVNLSLCLFKHSFEEVNLVLVIDRCGERYKFMALFSN